MFHFIKNFLKKEEPPIVIVTAMSKVDRGIGKENKQNNSMADLEKQILARR